MTRRWGVLTALVLVAGACGGDDDTTGVAVTAESSPVGTTSTPDTTDSGTAGSGGSSGDAESSEGEAPVAVPADLPAECVEAPIELAASIDGIPQADGAFQVEGAAGVATPIVPNGDGSLDDLEPAEFNELGAETDLLLYTQWIADFPFTSEELGFLGGAPTLPGDNIALGLSVTPPTSAGLVAGDVVSSDDELEYDSITTFGTATVFMSKPDDVSTYLYTSGNDEAHGGTATVLFVDDNWLCIDWDLAGATADPDGAYSIKGVVLTQVTRGRTPFT